MSEDTKRCFQDSLFCRFLNKNITNDRLRVTPSELTR